MRWDLASQRPTNEVVHGDDDGPLMTPLGQLQLDAAFSLELARGGRQRSFVPFSAADAIYLAAQRASQIERPRVLPRAGRARSMTKPLATGDDGGEGRWSVFSWLAAMVLSVPGRRQR